MAVDSEVERLASLPRKLDSARARRLRPFGSEAHNFHALAPVSEAEVRAFESRHDISLPLDYRTFITTIASGGAGPAYGLVPFDEAPTYERELPESIVSRPFPFVKAHNPCNDPAPAHAAEGADDDTTREEHWKEKASDVDGTLVLCHEGCGYLHLLVVNGAARGQMWLDATTSDQGYHPLADSFLGWYEKWIDDVLTGGPGTWWLQSPRDPTFERAMQDVKPWWRRIFAKQAPPQR